MEFQKITVTHRSTHGKGAARKLRAGGTAPAIVYGGGRDSVPVTVDASLLRKALTTPFGMNTVLEMTIEGGPAAEPLLAMVQDHQVHPLRGDLLHVDFLRIDRDRPVEVKIPLVTEGKSAGEAVGGRMLMVFREIGVRCLPDKIPADVRIDVSELNIGSTVKAGQLPLGEGVQPTMDPTRTVIAVVAPEAEEKKTEEEEAAEAAAAAAAEGAVPGAAPAVGKDGKPIEGAKPGDAKPGDAKPGDAKPAKGADAKPAKGADAKPAKGGKK
jgi:large subunit ribosomal protein L25